MNRVLKDHFETSNKMTIQMCLSICRSRDFAYAGLEWQTECYCGNIPRLPFEWAWPEKCDDRCSGNSNQICGGTNAISIWQVPPKTFDGVCVYNSPSFEKMFNDFGINGHSNLTVEECQRICSGKKFV